MKGDYLTSSASLSDNTDCNRLNCIQRTPCMDRVAVDRAATAVITFDVTVNQRSKSATR